jgi:integrase/recombinase XerD
MASIFLDIHFNGWRKYEYPRGLKVKQHPQTEIDKRDKKEKLAIAEEIKHKMYNDLIRGEYHLMEKHHTEKDFFEIAADYIAQHQGLKDIRMFKSALAKLKMFHGKKSLPCFEMTENYMKKFAAFLKQNLNGATPNNYLKKLKQMIKEAIEDKFFREDPTKNITINMKMFRQKAVLTLDERKALWATPCNNDTVKRGFLFCCQTGLRFCDVIGLKWRHIDKDVLNLVQQKTKVPVTVALNGDAIELLGMRQDPDQLIFPLPSHTGCLKWLRIWCKAAGITKRVTWHVARHTFATSLIENGVDVSIASKLLGHTTITHTQLYVRVSEDLKEQAINKLPKIS